MGASRQCLLMLLALNATLPTGAPGCQWEGVHHGSIFSNSFCLFNTNVLCAFSLTLCYFMFFSSPGLLALLFTHPVLLR